MKQNFHSKINVSKYHFQSFGDIEIGVVKDYKFADLGSDREMESPKHQEIIRRERIEEEKTTFKIDPAVKESRGLNRQEKSDFENKVAQEVKMRLANVEKEAYQKGLTEGFEAGHLEAKLGAMEKFDEIITNFSVHLNNIQNDVNAIYEKHRVENLKLVRNLTKWVILKEMDDRYLSRLLEKLILEINTKNNLVVRVNSKCFEEMPEVIKLVEDKLGKLTNLRLEIELDMGDRGIILDSENGIIDGSLAAQFESLDKLFEEVGVIDERKE